MMEASTGPLHVFFRYTNIDNYLVLRINNDNKGQFGLY